MPDRAQIDAYVSAVGMSHPGRLLEQAEDAALLLGEPRVRYEVRTPGGWLTYQGGAAGLMDFLNHHTSRGTSFQVSTHPQMELESHV